VDRSYRRVRAPRGALLAYEYPRLGDSGDYNDAALQLVQTHTYPLKGALLLFRPPFYPLFLAILYKISFQNFLLVKVTQALIDTATCYFIMRIGERIFDRRTGRIAFVVAAINPFFINWTGYIQTETICMFLFITSLYSLLLFDREHSKKYLVMSALLLAAAGLTRPFVVLFLPFICIYLVLKARRDRAEALKRAGIYVLCFLCLVVPWTIRNYIVYKEFILVNNANGLTFFAGNNEYLVKILSATTREEYQRHTQDYIRCYYGLINEMKEWPNAAVQKRWYSLSFKFIHDNPRAWVWLRWKNFVAFWHPYVHPLAFSKKMFVMSFVYLGPILFLGLFELFRQLWVRQIRYGDSVLVFMIMAVATSHFLITETMLRYRMPLVDPLLIVFASHIVSRITSKPGLRQIVSKDIV